MRLPFARTLLGVGLICSQTALLSVPPLDTADPRVPMLIGLPLAVAGGYIVGRPRAMFVPLALAVAGAAWLYLTPARAGTDPGPLDPVLLAAFYLLFSIPPVAIGVAATRLQGSGHTLGGREQER